MIEATFNDAGEPMRLECGDWIFEVEGRSAVLVKNRHPFIKGQPSSDIINQVSHLDFIDEVDG